MTILCLKMSNLIRFYSFYQMCLHVNLAPDGAGPNVVSVFVCTNQNREDTCSLLHHYITTSPAFNSHLSNIHVSSVLCTVKIKCNYTCWLDFGVVRGVT